MTFLQSIDRWHRTNAGYITFGLVELALGYLFFSLAVNSGSLWQYTLTLIFFVGAVHNAFLLVFARPKHAPKTTKTKEVK
jgi:hypothetical protein